MDHAVGQRYVGSAVRRVEDRRILSGRGCYVDDITLPGMAHAAFLRSPLAHARIVRVDATAARGLPGVEAVFTGGELEPLLCPGPYGAAIRVEEGFGATYPRHSCLATDKVRLVGDPIAICIAESRYLAEDAAELIEVDYEELPAVMSADEAMDPASPVIFEALGSNVVASSGPRAYGDVEGVFGGADRILTARIYQHRHQNAPIETRGCVASYDPQSGRLEVWSANQSVGHQRDSLAARLGVAPEDIRVRTGDVGGSFGLKIGASREDVAVAAMSRILGHPIKYIEDRNEHLSASGQAREEYFDVEAAYDRTGEVRGLKVKMTMDTGAYPGLGAGLPHFIAAMLPGPYQIEALQFEFTSVITNKASYVAYRGPWAAETFVRERVIDLIARELGQEPIELRRRNLVPRGHPPAPMVTGRPLTGIDISKALDEISRAVDISSFRDRQARVRDHRRAVGIGIAAYIEPAPGPKVGEAPLGSEDMRMYIDRDGTLVVVTGQMPHGQSHETTLAQIAADEMGVSFEDVRVVFGDSDLGPSSLTGGSRAATMAGGATRMTARSLRQKVLEAASYIFEASPTDLTIEEGAVSVAGVPSKALTMAEIVAALQMDDSLPASLDRDLIVEGTYDGGQGGWSGGAHCAIVEVDLDTGLVGIERYFVAEDCGEIINPQIVDGQVRGGVAQGIGAVLLERSAYDKQGNYLSSTFMDYLLPTATDIPAIEICHLAPVRVDPDVGFRGVGEGGMIVAPATVCNAIEDALATLGVRIHEQHLPPGRIWELAGSTR